MQIKMEMFIHIRKCAVVLCLLNKNYRKLSRQKRNWIINYQDLVNISQRHYIKNVILRNLIELQKKILQQIKIWNSMVILINLEEIQNYYLTIIKKLQLLNVKRIQREILKLKKIRLYRNYLMKHMRLRRKERRLLKIILQEEVNAKLSWKLIMMHYQRKILYCKVSMDQHDLNKFIRHGRMKE